jgi:hypothetical protein
MLYNKYEKLESDYIEQLYLNYRYRDIITHKNFNPRLISYITDMTRLETYNVEDYWGYISNSLKNPSQVWANPFNAQLDDFFRTNFFNDPTDVFGKNQSQRQFITMPSTTIPNDRESYQNWLYKMYPEPCKAGGREACYPGTDGGPIVSLNQYY